MYKTGLIMEGGAMRGLFTAGVIDVMMEHGIKFDGAAGISAGAAFGCNYKSCQIGRPRRYNERFCNDRRYGSLWNWLRTGDLFDVDFAYRKLPRELDVFDTATFAQNPMEFWVGATDVETGRAVYHLCTDGGERDIDWIRASASIPVLSRIVELDGLKLLDGGTADPVPYHYMADGKGYNRNVVILTQPAGFVKQALKNRWFYRCWFRRYPAMVQALCTRHDRYNALYRELEELDAEGRILVIRPPEPLNIKSTASDPAELERVYQIGRREGETRLEDVKAFLAG